MRTWAFWFVCLVGIAGCGGNVAAVELEPDGGVLSQSAFDFPADGQTGRVGPFCCTGRTVTITTREGKIVGYAYFFGWNGQALDVDGTSYVPDFTVRLAAEGKGRGDAGSMLQEVLAFDAHGLRDGTSASAEVGNLAFMAEVSHVDVREIDGSPYLDMKTLQVRLTVEPL